MEADELRAIASAVAHELRNPIAAIRALAQTGASMYDGLGDDDRQEFFRLIDDEAARLSQVADEAATALKLEAGSLAYDLRDDSVAEVVREAVGGDGHADHPVSVEADGDVRARVDRVRLGEVVARLIDNAAKFSPSGAPIVVRARRDDGRAVIEVEDRGAGIDEAHREAVFDRFTHVRPPGYEDVPGAGLGLFICRAYVEAHGGRIAVCDATGGSTAGTMLRVELPAERPPEG
jgi:two-component system, OmpR family, sensor histidine kinase KdpD